MNEHRLVSEFGWVLPLGDDVSIAVRPIVVLLVIAVVPLLIKYYLHSRLARETPAPWLYPIEVGYMPVSCLACDVFGVPVAASDSLVGQCHTIALVGLVMCFLLWYEALRGTIVAGQLAAGGAAADRRQSLRQRLLDALTLRPIRGPARATLALDMATRFVLASVLLFGVFSFGRFDLVH